MFTATAAMSDPSCRRETRMGVDVRSFADGYLEKYKFRASQGLVRWPQEKIFTNLCEIAL
jgi:hypothetical protein